MHTPHLKFKKKKTIVKINKIFNIYKNKEKQTTVTCENYSVKKKNAKKRVFPPHVMNLMNNIIFKKKINID